MRSEKFTEGSRKILMRGREESLRLGEERVGTGHVLLALMREDGIAADILNSIGFDCQTIDPEVEEIVGHIRERAAVDDDFFTSNLTKALELAVEAANQLGHNFIGREHLLLGLAREGDGVAARLLTSLGVTDEKVQDELRRLCGG